MRCTYTLNYAFAHILTTARLALENDQPHDVSQHPKNREKRVLDVEHALAANGR